ncbi:MAG: hypothetical protein Kow0047_05770 [Anaerolineae bacterium]
MWCHLLLAAPVIGLGIFLLLPLPLALPLYLGISGLSLFIYHKVWHAMGTRPVVGRESLIGQEGTAVEDLEPRGLVRVGGELWTAVAREPVRQGSSVLVLSVEGNKLVVAAGKTRRGRPLNAQQMHAAS